MSCCTAKLDTCRLIQESFKSPTFDFGDLDISQDDITYKVKRNIDTKFTDYPVTKVGSLVFIDEYSLPIGKYNHEMTWIHNGDTILVFQGNLEITDKSKGCGCNDSNNKIIKVEVNETIVKINYSENIIQVGKSGAIELVDTKLRVADQDPNVFTEQGNYSFNATVFNPEQFGGTPIEDVPEEAKYGAKGEMSFSWNGRADGKKSMAVMGSTAREDYQFSLGGYTDNIANTAVIVGAGEDVGKNRFMVYKDGGLGLLDTQTDAYKRVEVKDSKMLIDGIELKGEKGDTGAKGDTFTYSDMTEANKVDLASKVPANGIVINGNTEVVNGDKVNSVVFNSRQKQQSVNIFPSKIMFSKWENKESGKEILGVQVNIFAMKSAVKMEVAIYDKNFNRIVTSYSTEPITTGFQHFGMPYTKFDVGVYYIGVELALDTTDFDYLKLVSDNTEGFISDRAYPMPAKITSLNKIPYSFQFKVISSSNLTFTGFELLRNTDVRMMRYFSGFGVLGYNTTTFKLVKSVDNGVTWTDISNIPNASLYDIQLHNNIVYWVTSNAEFFKSTDITQANITWTDITPPLKSVNAALLPDGITIWQNHLWYGEYSNANIGELAGGPKIHRYNTATGVWTVSTQFPNARHAHSFTSPGTSSLYVCLGDAGWGSQVGYHRITTVAGDGVADTWLQWTYNHSASDGNTNYPVSSTFGTVEGVTCMIGGADRAKMFLNTIKITGTTAGQALINARVYNVKDAGAGETMRNAVLDARGNFYSISAESGNKRLICSPPPYIDRYVIADKLEYDLTLPMTRNGEFLFFEKNRFKCVTFENQASFSANTVNISDNILFDSINSKRFKYDVLGSGTGSTSQGNSFITMKANNTIVGQSKYESLRTELIDLTNIKFIKILYEVKSFTGTNGSFRVKTSTDTVVTGNTNGIQSVNIATSTGVKELVVNVSSITGSQYVFFQALAQQVSSIDFDIISIWLE